MKSILHIQKVKYIAGSENHLLTLLPHLREYGYEPTMLVLADTADLPEAFCERLEKFGVSTKVMRMRGDIDPALLWQLTRYIRRERFDLVHTHLFHADLYGSLAARMAGAPTVISTKHNDNAFRHLFPVQALNRWNATLFNRIICISHHMHRFSLAVEKLPANKMEIIHYGININQFQGNGVASSSLPVEHRPLLGIVGRLTHQKGHTTLLYAMQQVVVQYPTVHLVIVGDGELQGELEILTKELNLHRHVTFIGYQSDAKNLMKEFDIFVHPSRWEGFGLVFLEAMAAGRPIVATRVSAIPEIVLDRETGLLVPPDDAESLAQTICLLLDNPGWAKQLGENGRRRLEQFFTVERMVEQTVAVYDSIRTWG